MQKGKEFIFAIFLALSDLFALLISFLLAYFVRTNILTHFLPFPEPFIPLIILFKTTYIWGAALILIIFVFEKLYSQRLTFWEESRLLTKGITTSFIILMVIVFLTKRYEQFSRTVIVLTWFFSLFTFPLLRLTLRKILYYFKSWRKNVLILGLNRLALIAAKEIARHKVLGYEVKGFVTEQVKNQSQNLSNFPILGSLEQLKDICSQNNIKEIIVTVPLESLDSQANILKAVENEVDTIRVIPAIGGLYSTRIRIENLGDIFCLSAPQNPFKGAQVIIKFIFEFILVAVIFILLLPFLLLAALLVKLDSPGPIFFVQKRLGEKNKIFNLIKFRSMYIDGDERLAAYLEKNPAAKQEWELYRKLRGYDPRVTRVGRFLRKFSLDELPQLINFFKRDINLVGPRPYMPEELTKMGEKYNVISRIKPGITGLWQVRGRNLLTFDERLLLDEFYVHNWSFWLDIVILIKTIKAVATREGAY